MAKCYSVLLMRWAVLITPSIVIKSQHGQILCTTHCCTCMGWDSGRSQLSLTSLLQSSFYYFGMVARKQTKIVYSQIHNITDVRVNWFFFSSKFISKLFKIEWKFRLTFREHGAVMHTYTLLLSKHLSVNTMHV